MSMLDPTPTEVAEVKMKFKAKPPIEFGVKMQSIAISSKVHIDGFKWSQVGSDVFGIARVKAMSQGLVRSFAGRLGQHFPDHIHSTQISFANTGRYANPNSQGKFLNQEKMRYLSGKTY